MVQEARHKHLLAFVLTLQEQRFVVANGSRYLGVIPIPDDRDVSDEEISHPLAAEHQQLRATT